MDFLQYFIIRYQSNYTYSISDLCTISHLFMSIINVGTSDNSINTLHPPQCDMLLEDENISARTLADPEGVGVQLFRVRVCVEHQTIINNSQLVFVN